MLCDFGREIDEESLDGCNDVARYKLLYSVNKDIWEEYGLSGDCWGYEKYSCKDHLLNSSFIYDSTHGTPDIIYDLEKDREITLTTR
ncbi:MAG: hypothetical protein ABIJ14_02725 [Nanoarchaeota archaeon]|nr:hypothetical protein [Nanoarchaeota archaeon]